jgi:hypothetical protein
MSPSLAEIQHALFDLLRQDRPAISDPTLTHLASQVAAGSARLSPAEQIDIYREQFFLRHALCLQEDFAAIEALIGLPTFEALCRAYLDAHPPASFSLRDLGARMPAYLAGPWPEVLRDVEHLRPWLIDLSRLEWALVDAFDAADLPPLDPTTLAALTPDALDAATLELDPGLTLLSLASPVHRIQRDAAEGMPFDLPPLRPTWLAVYRAADLGLDWHEIPALEHHALTLLQQRIPLAAALDQVAATLPGPDDLALLTGSVGAWFGGWVQRGWVRAIHTTP